MGLSTGIAIAHTHNDLGSEAALSKVRTFILETLYVQRTKKEGGRHAHKQILGGMKLMPEPHQGYAHANGKNFPRTLPTEFFADSV